MKTAIGFGSRCGRCNRPGGPLAIAQHGLRDFLTAERASVSVKGYGVPSHFVARDAQNTLGGRPS